MSPMTETELRHELAHVPLLQPDDSALGTTIASRGRRVRRRNNTAAALAVTLVAAGGVGLGIALLKPAPTVATPQPTHTPAPVWADQTKLPGQAGDVGGRMLPLDSAQPGAEETITTENVSILCIDEPLTFPALERLTGGRSVVSTSPVSAEWQSVLVFRSEADAATFMAELRQQAEACHRAGPTDPETKPGELTTRSVPVLHELDGIGAEGLAFGGYGEISSDGGTTWGLASDAVMSFWGREGNVVAMSQLGGESMGDMSADNEIAPELRAAVEEILNP
ncbi:MAG: hypothetical protein QM713_13785 [Arachnia sp.]